MNIEELREVDLMRHQLPTKCAKCLNCSLCSLRVTEEPSQIILRALVILYIFQTFFHLLR